MTFTLDPAGPKHSSRWLPTRPMLFLPRSARWIRGDPYLDAITAETAAAQPMPKDVKATDLHATADGEDASCAGT